MTERNENFEALCKVLLLLAILAAVCVMMIERSRPRSTIYMCPDGETEVLSPKHCPVVDTTSTTSTSTSSTLTTTLQTTTSTSTTSTTLPKFCSDMEDGWHCNNKVRTKCLSGIATAREDCSWLADFRFEQVIGDKPIRIPLPDAPGYCDYNALGAQCYKVTD